MTFTLSNKATVVAGLFLISVVAANAQTLYAASGSNGVGGRLVTLNASTGAMISDIGALQDVSGATYGITGLAYHAASSTLYGVTSNASPTAAGNLVRINTASGLVTVIGPHVLSSGNAMSDITFAPDGTLYGWSAGGNHSMFSISTATGMATLVGNSGLGGSDFGGGGLASNAAGTVFASPNAVSPTPPGNLYTVSTSTGVATVVGPHTGLTSGHALVAMAFSGNTLFALDSDRAGTAAVSLATVNTTTGAITQVGATGVANLDAMAFAAPVPEPATLAALGLGALAVLRRRRQK